MSEDKAEVKSPEQVAFEKGLEERIGMIGSTIMIGIKGMPANQEELHEMIEEAVKAGIRIGVDIAGFAAQHIGPGVANKLPV